MPNEDNDDPPHCDWYDCFSFPPREGEKVRLKLEVEIDAIYMPKGSPFGDSLPWWVDESTQTYTNFRAWKPLQSEDENYDLKKELDDDFPTI